MSGTLNLITDRWIPVVRQGGEKEIIAPYHITDNYGINPVAALNTNRPDFDGALAQYLIGLLQTAMPPESAETWREGVISPPPAEEVQDLLCKEELPTAFNLDGPGPRFMQDLNLEGGKIQDVGALLIDEAGDNTLKENRDFFIKRGRITAMCLPCAAMALFTLQVNAPSGGQGHRTSLRGGGPLTTIVRGTTLWETVWYNVLERDALFTRTAMEKPMLSDKFPWMKETVTSEKGTSGTTFQDVHPAHVFWGMPRRIRLVVPAEQNGPKACSICGEVTPNYITHYATKNLGYNYMGDWPHPLSPFQIAAEKRSRTVASNKKAAKVSTMKAQRAQEGGIAYRHWNGIMQIYKNAKFALEPAKVLTAFQTRFQRYHDLFPPNAGRLWIFGYEMDNMKARCWHEATMPIIRIEDADIRDQWASIISGFIQYASFVASALVYYVKKVFRKREGKGQKKGKPADEAKKYYFIQAEFWQATEAQFYAHINQLIQKLGSREDLDPTKLGWLNDIKSETLKIFDFYSQSGILDAADPKTVAENRIKLTWRINANNLIVRQYLDLPERTPQIHK